MIKNSDLSTNYEEIPVTCSMNEIIHSTRYTMVSSDPIGGLYLGGLFAAQDYEKQKEKNIFYVLSVLENDLTKQLKEDYTKYGITHKTINIADALNSEIFPHFLDCSEFIDQALKKGNILVHCKMGVSRSASIVVAYLIHKKGYRTVKEALDLVQEKRRSACPNFAFQKQLKQWENYCIELLYADDY